MRLRGLIGAIVSALSGAILLAALGAGAANADPGGTWVTQRGDAKVRVARCGANLCGTIVWLKTPSTDKQNPDPVKRSRPVVGIQMIYGMAPTGQNRWAGQLYNPRDGKTYSGKLALDGDTMKLSGCVMGGLICKTETWTRAN